MNNILISWHHLQNLDPFFEVVSSKVSKSLITLKQITQCDMKETPHISVNTLQKCSGAESIDN